MLVKSKSCFIKNNLLILLIISMFTFVEKVDAKYEKLFFDHSIENINNETIDLNQYKGKTILLVNVASKCGFTKQYTGLQDLYEKYKDRGFYVIGVPSNQFGGQEPGTNSNYGNSTVPKWNFHKILINKEGKIQDTFNSFITPMSDKITKQIDLIL
jgi:glutathione peroxidase